MSEPDVEQILLHSDVVRAALAWKHQGARTKWSTPISLELWDAVDKLERYHAKQARSSEAS